MKLTLAAALAIACLTAHASVIDSATEMLPAPATSPCAPSLSGGPVFLDEAVGKVGQVCGRERLLAPVFDIGSMLRYRDKVRPAKGVLCLAELGYAPRLPANRSIYARFIVREVCRPALPVKITS